MNAKTKITLTPEQETRHITLSAKAQPGNPLFFDSTPWGHSQPNSGRLGSVACALQDRCADLSAGEKIGCRYERLFGGAP